MIIKGNNKTYKCTDCAACFEIKAINSEAQLYYCPTCGMKNINMKTQNIDKRCNK